jgi:hypothetical protein
MTVAHLSWSHCRGTLAGDNVEIEHEEGVHLYLDRHSDLLGIVEEVCKTARQEFGADASLALAVYRDPEIRDEYLALYVRLQAYPPDMLQRLRAVAAAHENQLWDKSGSLLVTSDFRRIS